MLVTDIRIIIKKAYYVIFQSTKTIKLLYTRVPKTFDLGFQRHLISAIYFIYAYFIASLDKFQ